MAIKRLAVALAIALLAAGSATAQPDPVPDAIGLFFDYGPYANPCGQAAPGMFPVFLVASSISCPDGILGWEARVDFSAESGTLMFLSATVAGSEPVNLLTAPEFHVTLGVPMPHAPKMLLATLNYFVMARRSAAFLIRPVAHAPTIPGEPCYADGADHCHLLPFHHPWGSWDQPVALLNYPCSKASAALGSRASARPLPAVSAKAADCWVVPTSSESWGAIKGMYR